jgi:hypothetical protein
MTLDKDNNPRKFRGNNREPMKPRTTIIVVIIALAVIGYAMSQVVLSGQSFF